MENEHELLRIARENRAMLEAMALNLSLVNSRLVVLSSLLEMHLKSPANPIAGIEEEIRRQVNSEGRKTYEILKKLYQRFLEEGERLPPRFPGFDPQDFFPRN